MESQQIMELLLAIQDEMNAGHKEMMARLKDL
jgi:hypothetical protein